jgi:hypothetical protein
MVWLTMGSATDIKGSLFVPHVKVLLLRTGVLSNFAVRVQTLLTF